MILVLEWRIYLGNSKSGVILSPPTEVISKPSIVKYFKFIFLLFINSGAKYEIFQSENPSKRKM